MMIKTNICCPQCSHEPFGGGHFVEYNKMINKDGLIVYYAECDVCGLTAEIDPETNKITNCDEY